nr:MAG TPA: hypothetical protein [Crassvirales sp.]
MKIIKLILKGILLWFTAIIVLFSVCGIDGIADKSYGWFFGILVIILISACFYTITEEEYKIISGYNLLNKMLKLDKDKLNED